MTIRYSDSGKRLCTGADQYKAEGGLAGCYEHRDPQLFSDEQEATVCDVCKWYAGEKSERIVKNEELIRHEKFGSKCPEIKRKGRQSAEQKALTRKKIIRAGADALEREFGSKQAVLNATGEEIAAKKITLTQVTTKAGVAVSTPSWHWYGRPLPQILNEAKALIAEEMASDA